MLFSWSLGSGYVRGLLGGGGGISSVSGSRLCGRFCAAGAAVHLSMNSKRICFVTGCRMLLHTAAKKTKLSNQ